MKRLEIDTRPSEGKPILLLALVVASLVIMTIWYREGDRGPLHVVRGGVLAIATPFEQAGTVLTTPLRALGNYVGDATVSRADYLALEKQNEDMKARLAELEELVQEAARVRALIPFVEAKDYQQVGARVIGRPSQAWDRTITLDRGTRDGVTVGAPVVAVGGLVGQVMEVTTNSSKVRLITATDSGVGVLVQSTRVEGVVRGSVDGQLSMDFVPKDRLPKVGDVLITSGMGGIFPKGLVVGDVEHVAASQADLYADITVVSPVDIDRIEEVLVLLGAGSEQTSGGTE